MYILYNMITYECTHVPHGGDLMLFFARAHRCLEPCRCINRTQCLGLFLSSTYNYRTLGPTVPFENTP